MPAVSVNHSVRLSRTGIMNEPVTSWPISPSSPMTCSFYGATSTIDDLTTAIADLSRIPSPDPVAALTCCCGTENCENYKSWIGLKAKLNQRLVLSAGALSC